MVKFPTEVGKIVETLEERGFEAYAVGGCVRDSLLGKQPPDWDIATNAKFDSLMEIFPEAKASSQKLGVISIKAGKGDEAYPVDVSTFRIDGLYSDHRRPDDVTFTDKVEDDLKRRDFTVNAMAYSPAKGLIDPFDGKNDIKKRIITTVGEARERFEEDPLRMMRAVRFASELEFDLHAETYDAIKEKAGCMSGVSADRIRLEFEKIIVAEHTGKGLRMLAGSGLMAFIIGGLATGMTSRAMNQFDTLAENIDKTKRIRDRRIALFYLCFEKKKALEAVKFLNFDARTTGIIKDAHELLDPMYFLGNKYELKKFVAKVGADRYEYLNGLSKAQRIVYDMHETKIFSRHYLMEEIKMNGEPIFIEDLAIDGNDIIAAQIAEGEQVGEILAALQNLVIREPNLNTKKDLMKHAGRYSKKWNKSMSAFQTLYIKIKGTGIR